MDEINRLLDERLAGQLEALSESDSEAEGHKAIKDEIIALYKARTENERVLLESEEKAEDREIRKAELKAKKTDRWVNLGVSVLTLGVGIWTLREKIKTLFVAQAVGNEFEKTNTVVSPWNKDIRSRITNAIKFD